MQAAIGVSSISRDILVKGRLSCDHLLYVHGCVKGHVYAKKLVLVNAVVYGNVHVDEDIVMLNSTVYGNITADSVEFSGVCSGDIIASRLSFMESECMVIGDIHVDTWVVKPGTQLNLKGSLSVSGRLKEMSWESVVPLAPAVKAEVVYEELPEVVDEVITIVEEKKHYNMLLNVVIGLILVITMLMVYLVMTGVL